MLSSLKEKLSSRLSPVVLAIAMAVLLAIWLLLGEWRGAQDEPPAEQAKPAESLSQVEARWLDAEPFPKELVLQGQLLPWQQVLVQAQVSGTVEELLKQQGDPVTRGTALLRLSDEGRQQQLAQAKADLRLRRSELEGSRTLQSSRLVSETEVIRLEGELARAEAQLEAAELAAQYSRPAAPFDGIVDRRHVEVGQFVQAGTELVSLVDVSRLKATAQIPQQDAYQVAVGQPVYLTLLDGRRLEGEVRFVSLAADQATRSFYVEVEAQNPELWRVAGGSVTLRVQLPEVLAHRLSPALLRLDPDGQLGVHTVDDDGIVELQRVRVVAVSTQHATVEGLPERVQVITQGAGFVSPGQQVNVQRAGE